MKRSKNTDELLVKQKGETKSLDKKLFLKQQKADGIIRVTPKEFDFFKEQEELTHFNLQQSFHKKNNTYLIMKLLEHGYFTKDEEKLPLLDADNILKFKCLDVKEKLPYTKISKQDINKSSTKSLSSLKQSILNRYQKSLPGISKKELLELGVSMTSLQKIVGKDSTRAGFGRGLLELGSTNKNVVALTADLGGSTNVASFAKKYPERFFQVGVAEQNLVTVASGLAHTKKIPYATTFAAFSPGRNFEQIRTTICYNDQPVKICSTHSGLGVGEDGATHQMLEDIALMRSLPNMIVIQPCDDLEATKATIAISKINKPVYLRLNRQSVKRITTPSSEFKVGKANILRKGDHITLIAVGPCVHEALEAANLLEDLGIDAEVINCHTIKPLDEKTILESAKKTDLVITIEDHQITGGLGGAVAELLAQKSTAHLKIIGVEDKFGESGPYEKLYKKYGLTAKDIVKRAKKLIEEY
ncbi:MAG: transketolase family protein [Candidatus Woesearchaeota archaeon]